MTSRRRDAHIARMHTPTSLPSGLSNISEHFLSTADDPGASVYTPQLNSDTHILIVDDDLENPAAPCAVSSEHGFRSRRPKVDQR
jgi:hypothetical protein